MDTTNLQSAASQYERLKAWGRELAPVYWTFKPRRVRYARPRVATNGVTFLRNITIRVGSNEADAHMVVLHELAHLADMLANGVSSGDSHGPKWRAFFLDAASEVVGYRIEAGPTQKALNRAIMREIGNHHARVAMEEFFAAAYDRLAARTGLSVEEVKAQVASLSPCEEG